MKNTSSVLIILHIFGTGRSVSYKNDCKTVATIIFCIRSNLHTGDTAADVINHNGR